MCYIKTRLKQSTSYFRINEKKNDTKKIRSTSYSNIFKNKYEFNKIKLLYLANNCLILHWTLELFFISLFFFFGSGFDNGKMKESEFDIGKVKEDEE